jgi:8-oxo-dGTP diphosphatase
MPKIPLTGQEKNIHEQVTAIETLDALEATHKQDVLDWIASGAPIFRIAKPDNPPKHLVSYFVLVDPEQKSMLLVDHIKAQLWLPSGGHVEQDEDPVETVRREAQEELRKDAVFLKNNPRPLFVTVTKTVGLTAGHTDVSLWYVIRGSKHEFIDFDRTEFNDIEWFTFDEILASDPSIFDPHLQRFTRKLVRHLQNK